MMNLCQINQEGKKIQIIHIKDKVGDITASSRDTLRIIREYHKQRYVINSTVLMKWISPKKIQLPKLI